MWKRGSRNEEHIHKILGMDPCKRNLRICVVSQQAISCGETHGIQRRDWDFDVHESKRTLRLRVALVSRRSVPSDAHVSESSRVMGKAETQRLHQTLALN